MSTLFNESFILILMNYIKFDFRNTVLLYIGKLCFCLSVYNPQRPYLVTLGLKVDQNAPTLSLINLKE